MTIIPPYNLSSVQGYQSYVQKIAPQIIAGPVGRSVVGLDDCPSQHDAVFFVHPLCSEQHNTAGMDDPQP